MAPRVVVAGYLVRYPLGGYAWQALHFLAALQALGCEVLFYEDSAYYAYAYVPGAAAMQADDYGYGVAQAERFLGAHGFGDRWTFWDAGRNRHYGLGAAPVGAALRDADIVVNLGGVNRIARERCPRAVFVYVDLDPAYTQIRLHDGDIKLRSMIDAHDVHFTFGENIGRVGCRVPTAGITWRPIRQPVVAELWPPLAPRPDAAFTTIGKWDSAGRDLTFGGEVFTWRKRTEWFRFLDLPRRSGARFRVALDVASMPDDLRTLEAAGWEVVDPLAISRDPESYRAFVRESRGEFTVAKDVNIRLASGWFSDRSACYLAAGRPVVNQDTGFDRVLPTGAGLFSVRTLDDAVAAFAAIAADYERHAAAARALACEHLAPARVLGPLLALVP
jgi:hypothetical protein